MTRKTSAFTLIELLTSIGIVMILVGITIGGLTYASSKADHDKTLAIMAEFEVALEDYKNDYGHYPIFSGAVNFDHTKWDRFTNRNNDNKKKKPYMEGVTSGELLDAFDQPFFYEYPNTEPSRNTKKYALWSKGKDMKHGNKTTETNKAGEAESDDICSWKLN